MARYWGKNITIDGSWLDTPLGDRYNKPKYAGNIVAAWEQDVQSLMRKLESTKAGAAVTRLINASPRSLRIIPHGHGNQLDTTANIVPNRKAPKACLKQLGESGNDVVIWIDPTAWSSDDHYQLFDPGKNMLPDDILLHELVHALRIMRGKFTWQKLGFKYDYVEEFYAILVANIYVAETGRTNALRADHRLKYTDLKDDEAQGLWRENDYIHYMNFKEIIDRLCKEMPDLTNPIASQSTLWNPLYRATVAQKMQGAW